MLIPITLKFCINLVRLDIFTILSLSIHEHDMSLCYSKYLVPREETSDMHLGNQGRLFIFALVPAQWSHL